MIAAGSCFRKRLPAVQPPGCGVSLLWLSLAVMAGVLLRPAPAPAGNAIRSIEPPAFDALLKNAQRPLIVVMMASWCGPCIQELPTLERLYKRYRGRGLALIGVSLDFEGPGAMQPLIDSLGVSFPVYWLGEAGARTYRITGIPLLWIVKNGEIREKILGRRPESFLERKIRQLLGARKPAP